MRRRGGQLRREVGLELFGRAAALADQERRLVLRAVETAGDVGVQALDAVREAQALKELERAVDGGRLGRLSALTP